MSNVVKTLRIGFAIFRSLCLLLFLLGVALQFSLVQSYILNTFVFEKDQSIQVEGSSGFFPFYFSLEKVSLFKGSQQFLTIKDFEMNWSLFDMLRYKILAIQTLNISSLEYKEIENLEPIQSKNEEVATITLPKIPFGYIQNINISKATYIASKKEFSYAIFGKTEHKDVGLDFNLKLINLITNKENLSATVRFNFSTKDHASTLYMDIKAFEQNGIIQYLVPGINSPIELTIAGDGSFSNFKGRLSAKLGKTWSLISDITTEQDSNTKHVVVNTQNAYKNQGVAYNVSGKIITTHTLDKFELQDWNAGSGKTSSVVITGTIHRRGYAFSTKNLAIRTILSKEDTLETSVKGKMILVPFMIDGLIQGSFVRDNKSLFEIDIPITMKENLESLKVKLRGHGVVPNLPKEYEQFAEFKVAGELKPKSAASIPILSFEVTADQDSTISGTLTLKEQTELRLEGQLMAHTFKIDSVLKNGSWDITGHTHPLNHQPWAINSFKGRMTPSAKLKFDAQTVVSFATKDIDLELKGQFDPAQKLLELVSLRAVHKESFIEGKGFFDFSKNEGDVNWHLYTFNIGDLLSEETATGTASILGQLSFDPKDHLLTFSGDFHKLIFSNFAANSGNISGAVNLSNNKTVQISLTARKASSGKTAIEDFSLNTNGSLDNFSSTIVLSGFSGHAFKGNFAVTVANLSSVTLDTASINLGPHRIFLEKPARIDYSETSGWITKTPLQIAANKGIISLAGNISDSALIINATLQKVPSDVLYTLTSGSYFLKGDLDGKFHAHGANSNPSLNFDLTTTGTLYSTHLVGTLDNNLLKTTLDITSDQLNMRLKGTYPTQLSLTPFSFVLNNGQPFETLITAKGKLDILHHIFDFNYDKIVGDVDGEVKFFGYLSQPSSKGFIKVKNGGYERQNIGLNFKGINLEFIAKNGSLVLSEPVPFKDHKENTGKILFAKLSLGTNLIPILSTEISSENLQIIDISQTRRGGMTALYTGNLKADGPVSSLKVFCRGSISALEKYIGELDDVPIFEVNEIHQNLPLLAPISLDTSVADNKQGMIYDIDLSLERSFHVYGQGLDSTWNGRLIIEGPSTAPTYKGQFKLRDGQLRVLDRFFDIQRGEIFFDGDLSPKLYIESNLNLNDMRVKIILEGDSNNLQKRIVSDSDLSEQEVLQKLFFNRSSTVSQSFQALNYFAASSFISSFINIGFYQQEDPITHAEREFVSLHQRFTKRTYGKIDVAINNIDSETSRVSIAAGIQPTHKTKTEIQYSPDKNRIGVGLEWSYDY